MTKRSFSLALMLFSSLLILSCDKKKTDATPQAASSELLIGGVFSLTGPEATFGISSKNAVDMVFDEVNQKGGLQGKKLRFLCLDNQGKPEESAVVTTKLITQDHVLAIIGEVASSRSIAMAPIAQANHVPMLSSGSTNPKVTEMGDYIFRTSFIDPFQGPVMAKFVAESLKLKKVAVFKDIKNDYSMGLAQFFTESFPKLGGTIVSEQSYSAGDIDFKAQLTAIRSTKPDFVYLPGYYTDIGLILRQARELGIAVPFGGGDGWDSPKLFEIGGKASEGCYFSNHYSSDATDERTQAFVKAYQARFGQVPDALAALAYDSAWMMVGALQAAKSLSGPDLRDALAQTKDFKGVTGTITFNEHRDPIKSAVILKIENGKQVYVTTVMP